MPHPIVAQLDDQNGLELTFVSPGPYNPDIVDDLKRRLIETYKEIVGFQNDTVETIKDSGGESPIGTGDY